MRLRHQPNLCSIRVSSVANKPKAAQSGSYTETRTMKSNTTLFTATKHRHQHFGVGPGARRLWRLHRHQGKENRILSHANDRQSLVVGDTRGARILWHWPQSSSDRLLKGRGDVLLQRKPGSVASRRHQEDAGTWLQLRLERPLQHGTHAVRLRRLRTGRTRLSRGENSLTPFTCR